MSTSFQVWSKFDRTLYERKLMEPALHMQSETRARQQRVIFEQRKLGQGEGVGLYAKVVDSALAVLSEYLEEVDKICCEVWQAQGEIVSPQFVRAVLQHAVFPIIAARCGGIRGDIELMALRTRFTHLGPVLNHLARERGHLEYVVSNRYDVRARELSYQRTLPPPVVDKRPQASGDGATTVPAGRFTLPPGLQSTGDPVGGIPFGKENPRHRIWQTATMAAEEELCRLNSKFLETTALNSRDYIIRSIAFTCAKFDIWAKRGIQTVWSEVEVLAYDQWLFNYAQGWLDTIDATRPAPVDRDSLLVELRSRLIQRLEYWKAEARRYISEQQIHADGMKHAKARTNEREAFVNPRLGAKGWSTLDWAKQSNVDFKTADSYLKCKRRPYTSTLKKLADSLGVGHDELPT